MAERQGWQAENSGIIDHVHQAARAPSINKVVSMGGLNNSVAQG
jgi:hypothetical protein